MTDYTKATGSGGTMMIRVLSTTVEFWIKAGSSNTFVYDAGYSWTVNGSNGSGTYDYPTGASWKKLHTFTVTSSQTVKFNIAATGTSGLGGPTSMSVYVDRGSIPAAPSACALTQIGYQSIYATFTDGSNGGLAIDTRQIGYGLSSSSPQYFVTSDRSTLITGLTPGLVYYFWARTHNSKGWSAWSARSSAPTLPPVRICIVTPREGGGHLIEWKRAIPYVRSAGVWKQSIYWGKRSGVWYKGAGSAV